VSLLRLALAAAAVTASVALPAAPASAEPIPYPPPPTHVGQCTLWWRPLPIFTSDVPVTPYVPYCVW
jgi:hypothetical protein